MALWKLNYLRRQSLNMVNFTLFIALKSRVKVTDQSEVEFEGTFKEMRLNYHNVPSKVKATKALLSTCTIRILCTTFMLK